jgi:hypothetical protein
MLIFLALLSTLIGAALLYLTTQHQQWRDQPLPKMLWRPVALLVNIASFAFWMVIMDSKAGFFAALAALMLGAGLVPFFHLLLPRSAEIHGKK